MNENPYEATFCEPTQNWKAVWLRRAVLAYVLLIPCAYGFSNFLNTRAYDMANNVTPEQANFLNRVFRFVNPPPSLRERP